MDDLATLRKEMRQHILSKLQDAVQHLLTFDKDRVHEVVALLLDPRHCSGQVLLDMAGGDMEAAKQVFKQYTDEALVPMAVDLRRHKLDDQRAARGQSNVRPAGRASRGPIFLDDDDGRTQELVQTDTALHQQVNLELKSFRNHPDLPDINDGENPVSPLAWWRDHSPNFPILSELARVILAVPASQIECERVFSLAGLLTKNLRNKMSPEKLAECVFCSKNIDMGVAVNDLLSEYYGEMTWRPVSDQFKPLAETQLDGYISMAADLEVVDMEYVDSTLHHEQGI